jgi:hypothetical protein
MALHISNTMRGSLSPIITVIGLIASQEEKEEVLLQSEKAFPITM